MNYNGEEDNEGEEDDDYEYIDDKEDENTNFKLSNRMKQKLYKNKILHELYITLYIENNNPISIENLDPFEMYILFQQIELSIKLLFPVWDNLSVYFKTISGIIVPVIYFAEKEYLNSFYKIFKNKLIILYDEYGPIRVKCEKTLRQRYLMMEDI